MEEQKYRAIEFSPTGSDASIRQLLEQYLYYWKWFVLGILVAMATAYVYLRYAESQYVASAQILLTDTAGNGPELQMLSEMGIQQSNAAVTDQIRLMQSRRILKKVVERTGVNIRYIAKGNVKKVELFADASPVQIKFATDSVRFTDGFTGSLKIKSSDNVKFTVFEGSFIKPGEYRFGENISSPLGTFALLRTSKGTIADLEILCTPALQLANSLVSRIQIVPGKENSSKFVNISLVDPVKERAALIINTLIEVYNNEMIDDGNKIAVSTSDFISKRLQIIAGDLQGVDKELAGYKSQNNINLSVEEAGMYMAESSAADREVITISTQLQVAQQLVSTLKNNKYVLLPSSVGIQETALNSAIDSYNRVVLERQEYARTMGESNPVLQSLNKNLTDLKENIQNSLALYQNSLQIALRAAELKKSRSESRLDKVPAQELGFRNIVRQQQIVEAVYLTLLQKREEAEIRSSASGDAVKVVDYAFVSPSPVTPNPLQIFSAALALGLMIPFAYVFLKLMLNNKVRDKNDIQKMYSGGYLGEIPIMNETVLKVNDRSSGAEAFRILRSNLNFVLPKTPGSKVLYFTSTVASEGKTFSAINFAQIYGLTGKKVLLVGADIRSPKILEVLNLRDQSQRRGLTDFLVNNSLSLMDVVIEKPEDLKFDIVHSGSIPPNPSELLMDDRYAEFLEEAKKYYDAVLVDTAPVGLVTDTQIISEFADATIYIVRAEVLDRRSLGILSDMHINNKLKNIAVVLNGVNYNKGYGYGYGYGYGETKPKKWWQRK